jgi:hypothetical protein
MIKLRINQTLIKEKGWRLYEHGFEDKGEPTEDRFLCLHSPIQNTGWELAQVYKERIYLNKRDIDTVMSFQDCPQVIKNVIMMYMI